MATLRHPASKTTNLAWGGDDWTTLFFTTAVGLGSVETRTRGIPLPAAPPGAPAGAPPAAPPGAPAGGASRPLRIDRRIERHHRDLDRIITPGTEIVELASGGLVDDLGGGASYRFGCTLEGPAWVEDGGYLFFSDIGNDRRMKWAPGEGVSVLHQPTNHANGATLDAAGRIVACEHSARRVTRRDQDGTITVVADQWEGRRLSRPNDVVVSSGGAVYFTAPWWDFGSGDRREIEFNGVFRVSPDLATVAPVVRDFELPNGLCFSPDESVLYVNDTRRHHIRAFDVLPDGALDLGSDRIFAELGGDAPGAPDGMKVDVEGNLYCGGSGGLWILNPSGAHLGTIVHGAAQTTNLAFGGPDWKTLFFVSWVLAGLRRRRSPRHAGADSSDPVCDGADGPQEATMRVSPLLGPQLGLGLGPVDQIAFVVRDLVASLPLYISMFGPFTRREATYSPDTTRYRGQPIAARLLVAASRPRPIEIELIEVLEGRPPQLEHLERHGEGIHHFRHIVVDLASTQAAMEQAGFETVLHGRTQSGNRRAYMGAPRVLGSTLVEILQRGAAAGGA